MHSVIAALEKQLLVWILGLAAGVFFVMVLVMNRVTQPFRRLVAVMTDPRTPAQYTRAPVYGVCEARDMAASFNTLVAAFATVQNELVAINTVLESRVQERTQELAQANRTLQQAVEARSQFLSRMSHEIRTPLHGLITSADLLRTTQRLDPAQLPYVQAIHHSAHLLLGVIDSVLDWAKIEAGELKLETIEFDLHGVLQRIVMALSLQAQAKGLALHLDIDPATPYRLRGDPTRLSQILMNLAGNAVKFTERGGVQIQVMPSRESAAETTLRFAVIDTGIGIPAAAQARIFDVFAQADESTTRRYGGTGLGTAIARHLVELMGGRIGVQSEPGWGSCFWFEVLLLKQSDEVTPIPRERQPGLALDLTPPPLPRKPGRPLRILVAEDNPTNQFVIRQLLQTAGHLPQLVGDGSQALRMLEREDFDLVLIDMHLPELDGCEVVTHYRQQHPGSVLPIVMLTADATPTAAERAYAAGVTAHLTKPITVDRLLEVIEQLATGPDTAVKRLAGQPPDGLSTELRLLCPEQLNQFRRRMPGQDVVDRLIDTYRCDAAHYLERIEQRVACAAWEDVGDVAHALRSASATVGAERVMALCQQLEDAAQMARTEELTALAEQLRLALTVTYAALEDYRRTLDFPMN